MFFFAGKLRQFEHLDFNTLGSTFDHISAGYHAKSAFKELSCAAGSEGETIY